MLLQATGITKRFGGVLALEDVSLKIGEGEVLACVGPNGAGKTTLLDVLSGWVIPDRGRLVLGGGTLSFSPEKFARKGIVRLFQYPRLFQRQTVLGNLLVAGFPERVETLTAAFFRRPKWKLFESDMTEEAEKALRELGIEGLSSHRVRDLSGGQLKLVQLAMVSMRKPAILLLDEPFANLSQEASATILSFIERQKLKGIGIIIVEHQLEIIKQIADTVVALVKGKVFSVGSSTAAETWQSVERAYVL